MIQDTNQPQVQPIITKECSKCHQIKSLDLFYKNKTMPLGVLYNCKECSKEYNRSIGYARTKLYMLKNKETIKQRANEFNKLKREELANLKQIKAKYDKLIKEQEENDTSKNKYIELNTHLMTEVYSLKQENEILKKLLRE